MAYFFADTFDCYSTIADCLSFWDSTFGANSTLALSTTGRFVGSRGVMSGVPNATAVPYITKTSGVNDAIHHVSLATQITGLTGTANWFWITLYDGTNAQCSILFRSDGAILLMSGLYNSGTTLATYTGAIPAINTWYQFEIEVAISNTGGFMNVRKLGNTSNDFTSATNLNTRAGSTNNYANKIGVACATTTNGVQTIDDFIWRSDASSVPWVGDVRGWARNPVSDASVQWTPSGSTVPQAPMTGQATSPASTGTTSAKFTPVTAICSGTVGSVTLTLNAANSGNIKCTIFASNGTSPTTVLGSATPLNNQPASNVTFTFGTPVSVVSGTQYWIGFATDTSVTNGWLQTSSATTGLQQTGTSYAAFPTASPITSGSAALICTFNITPSGVANAPFVAEPQQDAANSYVYSSTVGQSDLYGIAPISSTPASVVAVVTRAYLQKSDAGTRNTSVQLKSGSSTVTSTSAALNTVWGWQYRTDTVDPATGAAWTAVAVNNAQIGVVVTA